MKAGQLLGEIESPEVDSQLRQAQADLATAEANQKIAGLTAERWRNLRSSDSVSKQEADEKISLEYKLKRWLEGSLLDPDEAHFFWNGTFSPGQLEQIRPGTNGNGLRRLVIVSDAPCCIGVSLSANVVV